MAHLLERSKHNSDCWTFLKLMIFNHQLFHPEQKLGEGKFKVSNNLYRFSSAVSYLSLLSTLDFD